GTGVRPWLARLVPLALLIVASVQIWQNYPALDRSADWRPTELLRALTTGLDERRTILVADVNWQIDNGLNYFAKRVRPEIAWTRLTDVAAYAPTLVHDNLAIGRDVAVTANAKAALDVAYGETLPATLDTQVARPTLVDLVRDVPPGTRYVLCVLR